MNRTHRDSGPSEHDAVEAALIAEIVAIDAALEDLEAKLRTARARIGRRKRQPTWSLLGPLLLIAFGAGMLGELALVALLQ